VPIITLSSGGYVGAAQITGPQNLVDKTQAAIQVEADFNSQLRVKALIPIDSKNPVNFFPRAGGRRVGDDRHPHLERKLFILSPCGRIFLFPPRNIVAIQARRKNDAQDMIYTLIMILAFPGLVSAQSGAEMTALDKTAAVEKLLYGAEQTGSLVERVGKIERKCMGGRPTIPWWPNWTTSTGT
jgi:hypothetical protein